MKVVVKGILHPEDARLAVENGADGIIVSDHGGFHFGTGFVFPFFSLLAH